MLTTKIDTFEQFISLVISFGKGTGNSIKVIIDTNDDGSIKLDDKGYIKLLGGYPDSLLYRGQTGKHPLLPKLGRTKKGLEINKEKELISEIKRRGDRITQNGQLDDWNLLVYVQHFGLMTRLLDWTTNPLVALWFACQDIKGKDDAYVFVLNQTDENMLNIQEEPSPFTTKETKIFRPNLNNNRVIAQNGWFTAHAYNETKNCFQPLEEEENFKDKVSLFVIPTNQKEVMLQKLNILGINYETIYPGIEGTCKYLNWIVTD
jgi:hypothetical protein